MSAAAAATFAAAAAGPPHKRAKRTKRPRHEVDAGVAIHCCSLAIAASGAADPLPNAERVAATRAQLDAELDRPVIRRLVRFAMDAVFAAGGVGGGGGASPTDARWHEERMASVAYAVVRLCEVRDNLAGCAALDAATDSALRGVRVAAEAIRGGEWPVPVWIAYKLACIDAIVSAPPK